MKRVVETRIALRINGGRDDPTGWGPRLENSCIKGSRKTRKRRRRRKESEQETELSGDGEGSVGGEGGSQLNWKDVKTKYQPEVVGS